MSLQCLCAVLELMEKPLHSDDRSNVVQADVQADVLDIDIVSCRCLLLRCELI